MFTAELVVEYEGGGVEAHQQVVVDALQKVELILTENRLFIFIYVSIFR